jgi:hypothetical protein
MPAAARITEEPMHRRPVLLLVLVALAACSPAASESLSPSEEAPSGAPTASEAAIATGTITLPDEGGAVDGPGVSITEALQSASTEPLLVNGILLKDTEGTIWLCESLSDASPRQCTSAQLLVENFPEDAADFDPESADVTGLQEEDGVAWLEDAQLYGVVEPD